MAAKDIITQNKNPSITGLNLLGLGEIPLAELNVEYPPALYVNSLISVNDGGDIYPAFSNGLIWNRLDVSGGGAVASVFGRAGAVVAAAGDYDDAEVTAAAAATNYTPASATVDGHLLGIDAAFGAITAPPVASVYGRVGAVVAAAGDYDDVQVTAAAAATNYTPTGATVDGHLAGIDAALATAGAVPSVFGRTGAIAAVAGDYAAAQLTATPSGNLAGTTVEAQLVELDTEKLDATAADGLFVARAGGTPGGVMTGALTVPVGITTVVNSTNTDFGFTYIGTNRLLLSDGPRVVLDSTVTAASTFVTFGSAVAPTTAVNFRAGPNTAGININAALAQVGTAAGTTVPFNLVANSNSQAEVTDGYFSTLTGVSEAFSNLGTAGGFVTLDLRTSADFAVTINLNTVFAFSNVNTSVARSSSFLLEITNGGAFAVTFPASVVWPGGVVPTLTAAGTDLLVFRTRDAGTTWFGDTAGLNFS